MSCYILLKLILFEVDKLKTNLNGTKGSQLTNNKNNNEKWWFYEI